MWIPLVLLATLQTLASAATPEGEAPATAGAIGGDAAASPDDPTHALDEAVARYQAGDTQGAREALQQILAQGPSLPTTVKEQTLAWLGDVLLGEQGPAAAHSAFEALLTENPDFRMDPFAHPPEVVAAFEQIRSELRARAPNLPPPRVTPAPRRYPAAVLVPGGIHYFQQGRPVAGTVFGGLQLAGTAISVITGVEMSGLQDASSDDTDAQLRFRKLKAVNTTAAVVAWAAWTTPVFVETVRWGQARSVDVAVAPSAVQVTARF